MSRCPFWSDRKNKVDCYKECPMLRNEDIDEMNNEDQCIFKAFSSSEEINFKDIIKEDYGFLKLSSCNDDNLVNV